MHMHLPGTPGPFHNTPKKKMIFINKYVIGDINIDNIFL